MIQSGKLLLAIAALGAVPMTAGCNRTGDTSRQYAQVGPERPSAGSAEWNLPSKADQVNNWKPGPSQPKRTVPLSVAAQTLSCNDRTGEDGRIKVVCE